MALYSENREDYQITPYRLKEEQLDGIDFVLRKQNCILNLKPGTGKSIIGLVSTYRIMASYNDTVTFIICPKAANSAWKKELSVMKFKYSIITTDEVSINNGGRYFIFNYSNTEKMENLLKNLNERRIRVIGLFDEIHMLGSGVSGMSEKFLGLRRLFTCVIGLSGTPLTNDIMGLYTCVNFVRPGFLGNIYKFKKDWVISTKQVINVKGKRRTIEVPTGYKNLEELSENLSKIIITRGRDYPLKYYYRQCALTEEEWDYYKLASQGILDESNVQEQASARLWNLQKVADGCANEMNNNVTYSKKRLLVNLCSEIVKRNEGVLIYTELEDTYKSLGETIRAYKGSIGYSNLYFITGKVPFKDRLYCEKNLKRKDIVIVTKAGCQSINLQAVNNVIFYNIPFSLGNYIQMVGRVARTDSVYSEQNIYMLEAIDTIDTYKRLLLESHMTIVQKIFGRDPVMPYYGDIEKDIANRYKRYLKNTLLWLRGKKK